MFPAVGALPTVNVSAKARQAHSDVMRDNTSSLRICFEHVKAGVKQITDNTTG